ncbi:hypothetical protein PM082_009004 [Marasmius tenuissimus]|nr:hypothetical protein PM082_009004 [Marasmius tenuissimus]
MSFVHLPPEIWLRISEFSPRSDATRLCLVNHQFLSLIRPLIYHHVSLYQVGRTYNPDQADSWEPISDPIDATLSLLARDGDLAQREKEAEEVKETSAAFCEILRGTGLEELVVHPSSDGSLPNFRIGLSLEQFAGFGGLKKVGWRSRAPKFLSLVRLQEMLTAHLELKQDLVS